MTLRQLSYVLAVAETGSFTLAAQQLSVSQPGLSKQILALEAELGGPLFTRPPGPVTLTLAGQAFVPAARIAVEAAQDAAARARRAVKLGRHELRIATVQARLAGALPDAIRRWHQQYPGPAIHLDEFDHRRLVEDSVRRGDSQLGVAPRPRSWDGAVHRLGWEELAVVLPPGDPLLEHRHVRLADLTERAWVLFKPEHGLSELVQSACADAGFEPHAIAYTTQIDAAARLAAAGTGPALLPIASVPHDLAHVTRLLEPRWVWEMTAYTPSTEASPEAAALLELLRLVDWQRDCPPNARVARLDAIR